MQILFSLWLAFSAQAAPFTIDLVCATEPLSTTFGIRVEKDEVIASVIHHNGSGYAPAFSGIFTPNDIPLLAERAALVRKMLPITTFRWPLKNCSRNGDLLKCFGTDDVEEGEGGAKLRPFALYTTKTTEEGIAGRLEYLSVTVSFDVDGKSGSYVEMKYPRGYCTQKP